MTSTCMQLCQRCCTALQAKNVALRFSTHAHRCPAVFGASTKTPFKSSVIALNHTPSYAKQRWKQGACYYSDIIAKPVATQGGHRDVGELSGTEVVPHKNALSEKIRDHQMDLDLDAVPRLSALEELSDEEAVGISVSTYLPPASFSLRDYVDDSETLRKLVQLGVNLWKLEQRPNVGSMLLRLDFQSDVAPRLLFLKDIGVEDSRLGHILSHNPFILSESLENLQARVNYLRSMKFSSETVASMVSKAPYLLSFSVKRLDNRLGFYQKELRLSPHKTRDVVARLPRLLCGSLEPVKETLKVCKIEFGFKENEIQHIVTTIPKVLTGNKRRLTQIFDYVHNTMKIPHHLIVKFPQVLNARFLRIKERHLFLEYLGKAQYEPTLPNYVPLDRLVSLPDETFCTELASATVEDFELFQKTL